MTTDEKLDKILDLLSEKLEHTNSMNIEQLVIFLNYRYKKSTLYTMVCLGKIPHSKKPLRFDKNDILNWLKNKQNDITTI
jgi:hypothetical protein